MGAVVSDGGNEPQAGEVSHEQGRGMILAARTLAGGLKKLGARLCALRVAAVHFRFAAETAYRFENCVPRRAPCWPYFFRSFIRESRVR